jgi:hypothetical protein
MSSIKENMIKNYISSVDFNGDNWNISKIKEDMRKFLGEEPGIDVEYGKDILMNEDMTSAKEIIKLQKLSIVFYDIDNRFKKLDFSL